MLMEMLKCGIFYVTLGEWVNMRGEADFPFRVFVPGEPTITTQKNCAVLVDGQLQMHSCSQGSNSVCQKGPSDEGLFVRI